MSRPVHRSPQRGPTPDAPNADQHPLVEAARRGDEMAFRRLLDPVRGELYGHCYRMLASVHDAEDATQDVMLRAWRALATYEGRAPLRSWLHRIATNVCLDAIDKRRRRAVPLDDASTAELHAEAAIQPTSRHDQDGEPAGVHDGAAVIETDYEHREVAALAFGLALHLPAKQRAVLILREVLGFSARETASSLDTTITAVNSALQRARANLDDRVDPDRLQPSTTGFGDRRFQAAVERFMDALKRGDIDALVGIAVDPTLATKGARGLVPVST
jgi:RNA polymerase sigma-70 factor (ECF subfamily)